MGDPAKDFCYAHLEERRKHAEALHSHLVAFIKKAGFTITNRMDEKVYELAEELARD
jgi:hypothetical protein